MNTNKSSLCVWRLKLVYVVIIFCLPSILQKDYKNDLDLCNIILCLILTLMA